MATLKDIAEFSINGVKVTPTDSDMKALEDKMIESLNNKDKSWLI